ncbi:uncharacterized protein Z518_02284 [Rhinocladiella mackenziei CBS 650.93]|uniref:Rhinocladiella mackenziei CBS 650.93 unplaced genomic scaffold supercont1.2, whole genome shotgun sequence n=1 Tax=Rhinocladiella mackenziei CBS 650.93 TaxID=1442369 RepID=A0A0D2IWE5_9EURO|nr:uncharacterized protein Z518_02284 [Rhinocladiella mackenziei CBS 650.93]KIX07631.1 hypothetical protein Z518_02284 [Rhinocladiella mackenziei CBS 650.93]
MSEGGKILTPGGLPLRFGVIVCSQRTPRAGLQISNLVMDTLRKYQQAQPSSQTSYSLTMIDLAEQRLPLFDEPGIPSQIHSSTDYQHAHTRAWSDLISSFNAFVFVTPQYNWGYPASVKNAIDYLFNEWKGKPAMVVSYGGHGGGKAATQLKQVLQAVGMKVVRENVELTFPDRGFLIKAATGQDLRLNITREEEAEDDSGDVGLWAKEKEQMGKSFQNLLDTLNE